MSETRYTEDHEWVTLDGDTATIGITDHAQGQLGDIVFVELPEVGTTLTQGDEAGVVESVKAASEVYSPLDGEVTEVNEDLPDDPSKVNTDPIGDGWFWKMKLSDKSQFEALMDEAAYKKHAGED